MCGICICIADCIKIFFDCVFEYESIEIIFSILISGFLGYALKSFFNKVNEASDNVYFFVDE